MVNGDHDSDGDHDNFSKDNVTEPLLHRYSPYSSWGTSSTEKVKYILTNRGIAFFDSCATIAEAVASASTMSGMGGKKKNPKVDFGFH